MKKHIKNAKIACLDINLQRARMHLGVNIVIDDPSQLESIRKRQAVACNGASVLRLQQWQAGKST